MDFKKLEHDLQVTEGYLSTLMHDLRTPLTTMLGYVDLMHLSGGLTARQQRICESMSQVIEKMTRMLEGIDLLKRIELTEANWHEVCQMDEIFKVVVKRFSEVTAEKKIRVSIQLPEPAPKFKGSPDFIQIMLEQMVENSLWFTPVGGLIYMKCADLGDFLEISVMDDGIGIEADDLPFIFDRQFQGESRLKNPSGNGLGLAIVKAIAELHAGEVKASSIPNQSTQIQVLLPY